MDKVSDNLLSKFLEGNASAEEASMVLEAARSDQELRKTIELSIDIDSEDLNRDLEGIPLKAVAAREKENRCAVICELYVLSLNGIEKTLEDWERQASSRGWFKDEGTRILNIGRLLEEECFSISRTFHNSPENLENALKNGNVIVVVDGKELTKNIESLNKERLEDEFLGADPNHAVVITDMSDNIVSYFDPDYKEIKKISLELFMDAWEDSSRFMVTVSKKDFSNYIPHPLDLSDVELPEELMELKEAIAENAHEVWAQGRKNQGWSYGPERNDTLKQTPVMVPYSDLTEEEKSFDREMAINTIKLLRKLGYKIVKE